MPENFLYRIFSKAGLGAAALGLAFLFACQSAAEKDTAALKQDAPVAAKLAEIDSSIKANGSISPENFAALKTIREKYPNAAEVAQTYKNALIVREDWAALEDFLTATPLAELSAEDRRMLGKVYVKTGKYERSAETLKPLADVNPQDVETRALLGLSYFYLDRLDKAASEYDAVWDRIVAEKRVAEMTTRGIIFARQNDFSKAVETLKKALEINPSSAAATDALAQAYARAGDAEQAELYRARTVEINDRTAAETFEASRRVQQIYALETAWKAKNYPEVVELANRILPTADQKAQKLVLYQYLFESHKALGDERKASDALAEAQKLQQQK